MNLRSTIVDLRPDHLATVNAILLTEIPDYEVWAFGSRANWTAKDSSDLDLAIASKESVPVKRLRRLQRAFEESYLPFKVDVVDLSKASLEFRRLIEKQRVVLRKPETDGAANHPTDREWRSLPLEDALETLIDYRGKTPKKVTQGIPLITARIIKSGRIETPGEFISPDDYDEWMRRGVPRVGDVLLTTEAPLGEVAQLDERKVALAQRVVALRGKKGLLDNNFLKYLLQSNQVQDQLKSRASGTTVQGIKQSELRKISLSIPPLEQQRAIAHTLGLLDKKIELNRRMNETLETMAQTLFDYFFPYSPDNNLPNGWRMGRLDEVLILQRGFDLPSSQRIAGPYPVIAASGPSGTHSEFMARGPGVTTGRSGILGNVYFVHEDFWPLNTSLWVKEFKHSTPAFAFHLLRRLDFGLFNAGSAVPTLNRNHVHILPVPIPPINTILEFDQVVMPLLKRQRVNDEESHTIAALRDTLLPKLLSGDLPLKKHSESLSEVRE